MPTLVQADVDEIAIAFDRNGAENNIQIREALDKVLTDLTTPTTLTLASYDDDAAAGTGGLAAGDMYQTTGSGAAPLNAAGIVMIKQ